MFIPDSSLALPIRQVLPDLCTHLQTHCNVILVAPPGTGKTSLVPLSLLDAPWQEDRKIIMLEPRRVATRAAARQMAFLYQEEIGKTIGYRTRMEKVISSETRIEVVTYGLFLRHLLNNPYIDTTAAIIFDEIHERSLEADLCLTLCRNLQKNLRPDLRLIAMSATPTLDKLQPILDCQIIETQSSIHPLSLHYHNHDILKQKDLPKITAQKIQQVYQDKKKHNENGNILVFLPGAGEIHQTINHLDIKDAEIIPLYGDQSAEEQDRALRPVKEKDPQRIVLATSIAETSLTVPGVNTVIDGGFRKMPQFNSDTGLSQLQTQRISRAAAQQRAGRAGRETSGTVYKLWTQPTDRSLTLHDRPEILESELSEFLLICQAWTETMGIPFSELGFPDSPLFSNLENAKELLILLGAFDENAGITPFGQKLIQFGAHPRLASMMLRANTDGEKALAADIAALLEERDPFYKTDMPSSDIESRLEWLAHPPTEQKQKGLWYRIRQISQDYRKRLRITSNQPAEGNPALCLCAAFPDRLAQRRSEIGAFRFATGGSAYLPAIDSFAKESLLAVAKVHIQKRPTITLAFPITLSQLPTFLKKQFKTEQVTSLDLTSGRVILWERVKFGRLTLQDQNKTATAKQAQPVLLRHVESNIESSLDWNESIKQLQARCCWFMKQFPEDPIADISIAALEKTCDQWLLPWISHISTLNEIKNLDLLPILEAYLGYETCQKLNRLFPVFLSLNQHRLRIDYTQPHPVISAQAQKFYGIKETPVIAKGQISLRCCLLSPANRPQAITGNLEEFWKNGWKDMRKDMKGRYPKHDWPENPMLLSSQP